MSHNSKLTGWLLILFIVVTTVAWQTKAHTPQGRHFQQDTLPDKERAQADETVINGDLEKAMQEVKRAQENLERQLQKGGFEKMQKDLQKMQAQLNAKDMHAEIARAMKEIDLQKINLEDQMKAIDMQKIEAETQKALQNVNWEKMKKEMQEAHAEVKNNINYEKMEAEVRSSMEKMKKSMAHLNASDMQKIQQQLERAKEGLSANEERMLEEMDRAKKDINENLHKDFRKELEKAKQGVQKATEELQSYKEMIAEMQKDGLLKQDGTYNIKYKHGELYIDGVKQPGNITEKYKHYFRHENIQLKKSKDDTDDDKTIDL